MKCNFGVNVLNGKKILLLKVFLNLFLLILISIKVKRFSFLFDSFQNLQIKLNAMPNEEDEIERSRVIYMISLMVLVGAFILKSCLG